MKILVVVVGGAYYFLLLGLLSVTAKLLFFGYTGSGVLTGAAKFGRDKDTKDVVQNLGP